MVKLAHKKGYRHVGANEFGLNFILVKNGIAEKEIPKVSVKSVPIHPSVAEGYRKLKSIRDCDYIEG